jgi:hypothetical protein
MEKKLDECRLAARLRRRPPRYKEIDAVHVSVPSGTTAAMDMTMPNVAPVAFPGTLSRRCAPNGEPYSNSDRMIAAAMFIKLKCGDDFRGERVSHVSRAIDNEAYESTLKLDIAADRLLNDLLEM